MTLTTLIVVNAMLAGTVVLGMVWLLGSAIRADRVSITTRRVAHRTAPDRERADRLAA